MERVFHIVDFRAMDFHGNVQWIFPLITCETECNFCPIRFECFTTGKEVMDINYETATKILTTEQLNWLNEEDT